MYKLCKTEQSANRQRQLEQGLLSMMAETQYDQISVSDLCTYLQVPRKSFYRYFTSKDGALHALVDHTLMEYESITILKEISPQYSLEGHGETEVLIPWPPDAKN